MFGIGIPEILVILVIALIVIGPENLPEIAKMLGKTAAEFKKVIDGVKTTIEEEQADIKKSADLPKHASLDEEEERLKKDYEEIMGDGKPAEDEKKVSSKKARKCTNKKKETA